MSKPTIVDLFSGCGGFGLGAELAGFHSQIAVDIDETLQSAYSKNFPNTLTVQADIGAIEESAWRHLLGDQRPAGVIGGPPCQGFSRIGRRRADDPRNTLINHFFRTVVTLDPTFFIMENVEGLLDAENVNFLMSALELVAKRYHVVGPLVVKASDYGAPTTRTRVVIVGYNPEEIGPFSTADFLPKKNTRTVTVHEAISDLPMPILTSRSPDDFGWASYNDTPYDELSPYAKHARKTPPRGLGWETARKFLKEQICSGHEITVHSESVSNRYGALLPGQVDLISKSSRLKWGGLCTTLRAGTGNDRGCHQAVRPIHPDQARVITVREAARMQGFPDWYTFHHTKWHSFRMLGNSVSPIVAKALLRPFVDKCKLSIAA